ncbi:MAG: hypothetical protein QOJ74_402 [Ilumatobacteraceae bacterium]|jgi:hypothetical protein|nr:hypothetical protein [Ilumatobacteraceae bacterium]
MNTDAPALSWKQAYETAYRYVVRYYEQERVKPILRLLQSTFVEMPSSDREAWTLWEACIRETLDGSPLPELPQPWE